MIEYITRHWKPLLVLLSVAAVVAFSATSIPVTNPNDGHWTLTAAPECEDSSLMCVVWEYSDGGTSPACCVTHADFVANEQICTSNDFRD